MKIGLTEMHGIARENAKNGPKGYSYHTLKASPKRIINRLLTSTAKGVFDTFEGDVDLVEAPLFPVITKKAWIYTPADFHSAVAFSFLNIPLPRFIRCLFIRHIFLKKNFKKLIFKSQAGLETMKEYPFVHDKKMLDKAMVIYPAIRKVDDSLIKFNQDRVNILFSGDFVRKGGIHVVDAFVALATKYEHIYLKLCTKPDLQTNNQAIKDKYTQIIQEHPRISMEYVNREKMLNEVLPSTDIFASPTYQETFGFAILEAMAYGLPIIATEHFAIPEMITHGESGFLIETEQFDFIKSMKGYAINTIPDEFNQYMLEKVTYYLDKLISSESLRKSTGEAALHTARSKFSFHNRNQKIQEVYDSVQSGTC